MVLLNGLGSCISQKKRDQLFQLPENTNF